MLWAVVKQHYEIPVILWFQLLVVFGPEHIFMLKSFLNILWKRDFLKIINLYRVNHNTMHCGQCYIHGFGSVSWWLSYWGISGSSGDVAFFVFNVDQWQLFFHYYFCSGVICKIGCDESKILFCGKYNSYSVLFLSLYVYL